MRKGAQTLVFESKPVILSRAAIGGKKEGEGPLAAYFDFLGKDAKLSQKTFEKAESKLQELALDTAKRKLGVSYEDIDVLFAGDLLNQCAEIPGHDQVIVLRHAPQIAEMRLQRIDSRRGHGCAHVVRILDAEILHAADRRRLDAHTAAAAAHDAAAGASHGPLGRRRALAAVAEREAVLPLCRGEV